MSQVVHWAETILKSDQGYLFSTLEGMLFHCSANLRSYPPSLIFRRGEGGHDTFTCRIITGGPSSMWTFALLRDSSDLHIYKDLYGERNKPEKKRKITVELQ